MSGRLVKGTCQSVTPVADSEKVALMRGQKQSVHLICDRESLERLGRAAHLVGRKWRPIGPADSVHGRSGKRS